MSRLSSRPSALAAFLAFFAALLALPQAVQAGRYRAVLCETPAGRNAPVEGIEFTSSSVLSGATMRSTCGTPGGVVALGLGRDGRTAGQFVRARIGMPTGLTIYGLTARQRSYLGAPAVGSADSAATPAWTWYRADAASGGLEWMGRCLTVDECIPAGWSPSSTLSQAITPVQRSVTFEVSCLGTAGGVCAGADGNVHRAYAEAQRINLGVEDLTAPTGQLISGELPAALPRTALLPLRVSAADVGGGVLEAAATFDGTPGGVVVQVGDCADRGNVAGQVDYESIVPCPRSATLDLAVDPSGVADGPHSLKIVVRDAAHNETVIAERSVVVGDPALGPPQAQLVLDRASKPYRARYGRKVVIRGKLLRLDGVPLGNTAVAVQQQASVPGAGWEPAGSLTTALDGSFAFEPVTKGSRTLRFAYGPTTAQTQLIVRAGMRIEAPRTTVSRPADLVLRGRVLAEPLPKAGAFVEIQVRDRSGWRAIGTRRTDAQGDWKFTYPLRGRGRATYQFRARLRKLPTVPSEAASSGPVRVRVR